MTAWDDYVSTGVGGDGIEYRLVIEGAKYEFCTTIEMVGACLETDQTGKRRVGGLQREGLGFAENVYLAGAELSVSINAVRIMETPAPELDSASAIFAALPTVKAWLLNTITTAATSATVNSDDDLVDETHYHVGTETVRVTSLATPDVPVISRGQWRTTAQRHAVTTVSARPQVRALRDGVRLWAGRRAWLYAHGRSEFALDNVGELIWRGKLAAEPQLDGADAIMWNLPVDSRWSILDQEIGSDFDKPRRLRGAYYPGEYPFRMKLYRSASDTRDSLLTDYFEVSVVGHYESNEAFGAALSDALNTGVTTAGWGHTFSSSVVRGQWEIIIIQPVTPRFVGAVGGSCVDGYFDRMSVVPTSDPDGGEGTGVFTVEGDEPYYLSWGIERRPRNTHFRDGFSPPDIPAFEMRRLPRMIGRAGIFPGTDAEIASYPLTRLYLDDVSGIAADDVIMYMGRDEEEGGEAVSLVVDSTTTSTGAVDFVATGPSPDIVSSGEPAPTVSVVKKVGDTSAGISLAGFRDALITAAPEGANDATTPWVLADDLASWTDIVNEAALGNNALLYRRYVYHQGVRVSDVIKHEMRLLGVFPHLDADFKVALRTLTANRTGTSWTIADSDGSILTEGGFGELKSGEDGNVNTVEFSTGYDPKEDKHSGAPITVVNVEGVSEAKKRRVLEVKPKSAPVAGIDLTADDALRISTPIRTLFGDQIIHYTFEVPITFYGLLVGDTIIVTSPQVPYAGYRTVHDAGLGLVSRRMLVVGREWDLEEGTGKITGLVTGINDAGYTPTGRIASAAGATTTWVLTLTGNYYSPTGAVDASYFIVGDLIRVLEWDSAAPTVKLGEVTAVSGNDVSVTIESWTGLGGATYILAYQDSDLVTDTQLEYAFCASGVLRIADGGSGTGPRVFAP